MSRSRRTIETNNYLELLIQELRKGSHANPINIKQFIKYALQTISKQEYYSLIKTAINCKCAGEIVKSLLANVQQDKSILTDIFNNELKKGLDANLEYIEIFQQQLNQLLKLLAVNFSSLYPPFINWIN